MHLKNFRRPSWPVYAGDFVEYSGWIEKRGNTSRTCHFEAYESKNGYVMMGVGSDPLFKKMCQALGHPKIYKPYPARCLKTRRSRHFHLPYPNWRAIQTPEAEAWERE